MTNPTYPIGVLIMAYGGPNSLEELPGYLSDIRAGRPTTPAVLEEISHNYSRIGGSSPLLEITQQQIAAVTQKLAALAPGMFRTYLGMRHWAPWIEEVVGEMLDDGITHAISLVLAPHFSKLSVAKYQGKIADGLEMYHGEMEFRNISSYHTAPKFIEALANRVEQGISRWPEAEQDDVHVIFSAHSLPVRIIKMGDPYDEQLRETAHLVADKAGLDDARWSWSYQSAGRSPEPWLGPQLEDYIPELHRDRGVNKIVSIPVGFVSDHVEILYDIDIQAQEVAQELDIRLERPPALNLDPLYIDTLVDLILAKAEGWLPQVQ
jgi:ferrochelatase